MKLGQRLCVRRGPAAQDHPIYHQGEPRREIGEGDEVVVSSYHLELYHGGLLAPEPAPAPAAAAPEPEPAPAAPAPAADLTPHSEGGT